jgi:tetratricopeptide (TPR) repeat protein
MKKLTLALLVTSLSISAFAQDGNNICVWNAMNTYNSGGGPNDLERGIKCSDDASVHENTMPKSKTWFYRGELYTLAFIDTVLREKYPTAAFEAIKAFKKLNDLSDPKFKEWEEVNKYMLPLATNVFNRAVDFYQDKNYAQAFQYFYAIKDINAVLTAKGKTANIDLAVALKNAAISAENAGDTEGAINVYKDWLALAPDPVAYRNLAVAYKKQGKGEESKKTVDEGLSKFPKDANLLVEKINVFLEGAQYTDALTYVNNLLEVEPKNDGALFIKGLAYEKIGNEDSVVYYYLKSAEINPKNVKPWNNLGAIYVAKANALVEPMNKLGNTAADIKKYNEMKAERRGYYLKAKPYLDKAHEIDPNDAQINRVLKQVELYTAE